jgi:hypothetical protein
MAESFLTRKGGGGVGKYSTWVAQAENSAKYTVYNGYDAVTNPNPNLSNLPYNQWLLNNSASGSILINNATLTLLGNYNTPDSISTETFSYSGYSFSTQGVEAVRYTVSEDNLSLFTCGSRDTTYLNGIICRFNTNSSSPTVVNSTSTFSGHYRALALDQNNGFLYVGTSNTNANIRRFHANNLVLVTTTPNYALGSGSMGLIIKNNFIYWQGYSGEIIRLHLDNLALESRQNNGMGYAAGRFLIVNNRIISGTRVYHESNLAVIGDVPLGGRTVHSDGTFLYSLGSFSLEKYWLSNLTLAANTVPKPTTWNAFAWQTGFLNNKFYGVWTQNNSNQSYFIRFNTSTLAEEFNSSAVNFSFSSGNAIQVEQIMIPFRRPGEVFTQFGLAKPQQNTISPVRVLETQQQRVNIFTINRVKE